MLREIEKNGVHTNQSRAKQIRKIVRLLQAAGERELDIILAFVRALVRQ